MTLSAFHKYAKDNIPPEVNMVGLDVRAEYNGMEYEYSVYVWFNLLRTLKTGEGRTPEEAVQDLLYTLGYAKKIDMEVAA